MERTYSTGQAAKIINRTPQHCKTLARTNHIAVNTQGDRGDWTWTMEQILSVKKLVEKGVAK